jgi:TetR/AcrR family transcriptional repressor of nem operon
MTTIMYIVKWYPNRGKAVRVTREQAEANREKVLDVASTLFRERGFDGIGVADIMKHAGLTHGGFYGQFVSKEDLAAEVTARVLENPGWQEWLTGKAKPSFADVIRGYLSPRHRDDPGTGCLIAALGADSARQPRTVRRALTAGLRVRLEAWMKLVPGRSAAARREKALVTMATLVGALIIARAVDDPALSDEVLEATATELRRR